MRTISTADLMVNWERLQKKGHDVTRYSSGDLEENNEIGQSEYCPG
jgi:hypothetical protein